jgi:hypothetical protein
VAIVSCWLLPAVLSRACSSGGTLVPLHSARPPPPKPSDQR